MVRNAIIIAALSASANAVICGYKFGACADPTLTCTPFFSWCSDTTRCVGQCLSAGGNNPAPVDQTNYQFCGGMMPGPGQKSCPSWAKCMSDPRDSGCGIACDSAGICVPKAAKQCGGIQGLSCPSGQQCYDDPTDSCDPNKGGADCIGICLYPYVKATASLSTSSPTSTSTSSPTSYPTSTGTSKPVGKDKTKDKVVKQAQEKMATIAKRHRHSKH